MVVGFGTQRSFLFLQGLSTPFWVKLAREIEARGHRVHRILLSGGDRVFWPKTGAVSYRGRFSDWRQYLGGFLHDSGISDVILFGDCRPYHQVALEIARSRGIAVHVFEEGYFRPNWITLERDGTNAFSSLPRSPESIFAEAAQIKSDLEHSDHLSGGFANRIAWEMLNQASLMALTPFYPRFQRHREQHPLVEMSGWLLRLFKRPLERIYTTRISHFLEHTDRPYYLLPLQLESDYQMRRHSHFESMTEGMEVVLTSFAENAPAEALLVIKLHPLDNGLVDFRGKAKRIAARLGIEDRVVVIDGGHLPSLLTKCDGIVTINSTTGLSALHRSKPIKVLGKALFDIPGLTFQGSLDRFWQEKPTPDTELFNAFRKVVLARAQVNGSFFTGPGMERAVEAVVKRLGVTTVAPIVLPQSEPVMPEAAAPKSTLLANR